MASSNGSGQVVRTYAAADQFSMPDPYFSDYISGGFSQNKTAVVIDNGSFRMRGGWAGEDQPRIDCRSILGKLRTKQGQLLTYVGSDIRDPDSSKWLLRYAHDSGIATNMENQEHLFDHTFTRLGITSDGCVPHPLFITEAICTPNQCRRIMSELAFEGYAAPSLSYGVDAMCSFHANVGTDAGQSGIVVNAGHTSTHVLPVVNGRADFVNVKRLDVGGWHAKDHLLRVLQLKYPQHLGHFTVSRAQHMVHEHAFVALDLNEEQRIWADERHSSNHSIIFQLPYVDDPVTEREERRRLRAQQAGERLRELQRKKRLAELERLEEQLSRLNSIAELHQGGEHRRFKAAIADVGLSSAEELDTAAAGLEVSITRLRNKIEGIVDAAPLPVAESALKEPPPPPSDLLNIPDKDLNETQVKEKKKQRFVLNMYKARIKSKRAREAAAAEEVERARLEQQRRLEDPAAWIAELHERRNVLLERREKRTLLRNQLQDRRSYASQSRMRVIVQQAGGVDGDDEGSVTGRKRRKTTTAGGVGSDDQFGINDSDWSVYRFIDRDDGSDDEHDETDLADVECLLRENDAEFSAREQREEEAVLAALPTAAEIHQVVMGTERFRVAEIVFQPYQVGVDQAGLIEVLEMVLRNYTPTQRAEMVRNIVLTGGNVSYPGFRDRVEREVRTILPSNAAMRVITARNACFDAWRGASKWAALDTNIENGAITRAMYDEVGGDYLVEHNLSNRLWRKLSV